MGVIMKHRYRFLIFLSLIISFLYSNFLYAEYCDEVFDSGNLRTVGKGSIERRALFAEPVQAANYYISERLKILNQTNLDPITQWKLFQFYTKKLERLVRDSAEVPKVFPYLANSNMRVGEDMIKDFEHFLEQRILYFLSEKHYQILPGMAISSSKTFEKEFGLSFSLIITRIQEMNEQGIEEYQFVLTNRNVNLSFFGRMNLDIKTSSVKLDLMPSEDGHHQPTYRDRACVFMGLFDLVRMPQYRNVLYQGGSVPISGESNGIRRPTVVGKDVKRSVFHFRRRTISDASDAWIKANELVRSLDPKFRKNLEQALGGQLYLKVYYVTLSAESIPGSTFSNSLNAYIRNGGLVSANGVDSFPLDMALVNIYANLALKAGTHAVITLEGVFVPPEIRGEQSGKPKGPHVRRMPETTLVVSAADRRMSDIFARRRDSKDVSTDELLELDKFLSEHGIVDPFTYETIAAAGVHYQDGTFHEGSTHGGGGQGGQYIIVPDKVGE